MPDSEPPSFVDDDLFGNSSDTDAEPYPGREILHTSTRPSRSSTLHDTPSAASRGETSEPPRIPKRGRDSSKADGADPRAPEQMFKRWHAKYPQSLPDPATERRTLASMKGRPGRVLDVSGRQLRIQFYLLQEHPYDGVWLLTTYSGRRLIVQRKRLSNKTVFPGPAHDHETAQFGFFEWLQDWKFNKEPSGYIISEALNYTPISDKDVEKFPTLQATGPSPNTPQSSSSVSDSKKSPALKKQKGTKGGSPPSTLRRSHRERTEPRTYRISFKSFGHYADESFASTSSAFRTPESASSALRRATRSKAPSLSQSASHRKSSVSPRTKRDTESTTILNEGAEFPAGPNEGREALPIRKKSNASPKTKTAPPNVTFRFLINEQGGVRDRRCDNIKDFFEQVQKAAVIEAAATGKDPVHQGVVMCRLTWLADGLQHGVMEDEPEDFEVLLGKMRSCPAGEERVVEVRRLK